MNLTMPQILIVRYKEIENFNNMNKTNNCFSPTGTCFIQKIYAPPLPYFKVNICPFPLPHFASIFFVYL
jgi:hypothetical protein